MCIYHTFMYFLSVSLYTCRGVWLSVTSSEWHSIIEFISTGALYQSLTPSEHHSIAATLGQNVTSSDSYSIRASLQHRQTSSPASRTQI